MRIRLFTLPNIITLSNLICGSLATIKIVADQDFTSAFWLVILASCFDFLDGFAARMTGQYSKIGAELDSLADMISFGLVPSLAMFYMFQEGQKFIDIPFWSEYGKIFYRNDFDFCNLA